MVNMSENMVYTQSNRKISMQSTLRGFRKRSKGQVRCPEEIFQCPEKGDMVH
jgi:hypothetical protein